MEKTTSFEQGPIRPPSEARSLLLRITRNCPWNQCLFCPAYKKTKFSLRTVSEIKEDIQIARDMANSIKSLSHSLGYNGKVNDHVISTIFGQAKYGEQYRGIAAWLYYDTGACFLQDADNLVIKTEELVEVLKFLKEKFPEITRITTYSRSRTIIRKSIDSLKKIKEAGLNRIHVGLETSYDPLLKLMKKGVTASQHIEAGQKVMAAGIELSEYVMPGLGGQEMWNEHAIETARALNQINPDFIRLRTLRVPVFLPLYQKIKDGTFTMQKDDMVIAEIKVFIESLDGITCTIASDHMMNLLEEVSGKLPHDKSAMLEIINQYQDLPDLERSIYRVGRRGCAYRSVNDLTSDPATYNKIKNLVMDIQSKDGKEGIESFLTELSNRFI